MPGDLDAIEVSCCNEPWLGLAEIQASSVLVVCHLCSTTIATFKLVTSSGDKNHEYHQA